MVDYIVFIWLFFVMNNGFCLLGDGGGVIGGIIVVNVDGGIG